MNLISTVSDTDGRQGRQSLRGNSQLITDAVRNVRKGKRSAAVSKSSPVISCVLKEFAWKEFPITLPAAVVLFIAFVNDLEYEGGETDIVAAVGGGKAYCLKWF